jgi:hypothetical protein
LGVWGLRDVGFEVWGLRFGVQVWGVGFRVWSSRLEDLGLRFGGWGLECWDSSLGIWCLVFGV